MANVPLRDELLTDPLGRAYAGMTDEAASADLRSLTTGRTQTLTALSGPEIYEAFDDAEYDGLSNGAQRQVDAVTGMIGEIAVGPGSTARATLTRAFGGGSLTVDALVDRVTIVVSRATEQGLGRALPGHVHEARR